MKKTPRPEAIVRHARLFGARNIRVAQIVMEGAKSPESYLEKVAREADRRNILQRSSDTNGS